MNSKLIFAAGATVLLVACAVNKVMTPVSGSRADGTVTMAYEYGMFEKPHVDLPAALDAARAKCRVWGYQDAEAFGGVVTQCEAMGSYGCARTLAKVEYQCTGANTPS